MILPSYIDFLKYIITHNGSCPPVYSRVEVSCKPCYFKYYCHNSGNKTSPKYRKELAIKYLNTYSKKDLEAIVFEELL